VQEKRKEARKGCKRIAVRPNSPAFHYPNHHNQSKQKKIVNLKGDETMKFSTILPVYLKDQSGIE